MAIISTVTTNWEAGDFISDLATTVMVPALKPTLFLLGGITTGNFLLFIFSVQDSTKLKMKNKKQEGVKNLIIQVARTRTQAKMCVLQNLSSYLSNILPIPSRADEGLGGYFPVDAF